MRLLKRNWLLWVLAALLSLTVFAASGCSPGAGPKPFRAGEFVELRLTGERGQIVFVDYLWGPPTYRVRIATPPNVIGKARIRKYSMPVS
jgi:hypothetical protein